MTAGASGPRLDHVVIGVADLEAAATQLTAVLGRRPSWRGRHPTYGTANVLYRLDNAYLELLAPDQEATATSDWTAYLSRFLNERGAGLFAGALATPDIATTAAGVRSRGLPVEEPAEGEGVDLISGAVRRWSGARIPPDGTRGAGALFIEHRSPADALPVAAIVAAPAAAVTGILALSIESADAEAARKMWHDVIGLPQEKTEAGWRFDLGNATLLLWPGAGEAEAPDRWQRLVLGTSSLTALADRLDRQGAAFEQGDFREGYGVRLDCCGADLLLTAPL